ncbi:DUF1254 domain-containing protein [Mycolicibacterium senegalense]|uniref:DUF1254 domain-containing protein n=1 Tax=Mycolicibacterium TaxID=1866885 RepID=UPI0032047FC6
MNIRYLHKPRRMRRIAMWLAPAMLAATLVGCGPNPPGDNDTGKDADVGPSPTTAADSAAADAQSEEQWAYSVGIQNYVFGVPLTIFERERSLRLDPAALEKAKHYAPAAPINQIGHMKNLATADDVMPYTPNNDTVYSGAVLDLRDEPMILSAPDIPDRYWSVEVADAYTNNVLYIGTRATGGKGGNHAFVGPNWQGTLPAGVIEHRVPTNGIMLAIRLGVVPGDAADLAAVNALQDKFTMTSLSNWSDPGRHGQVTAPTTDPRPHYDGDLAYFQTLADLLTDNPPPPGNEAAVELLGRGGITVGKPMDIDALSDPTRRGLARAAVDGPKIMDWKVKNRGTPYPTHWNNLVPGTYGVDYFDRAAGADQGLFVHDRDEAEYFSTYDDGAGEPLDSAGRYLLHFNPDQIPPTLPGGFWSITMYGPDFQLVKNPINRFSIGDRTPGLVHNPDGSLDIYLQNQPPQGHESNWLPTPASGAFRLNYRIYLPTDDAKDPQRLGKYLPPVTKTG